MFIYLLMIVQISGWFGYSYTGIEYFLYPAIGYILYNMYNFVKINSLVLSPAWNVELDLHESTPLREKFLLQLTVVATLYLLYEIGYTFLSGAGMVVSTCFILSFFATVMAGGQRNEEEDDEEEDEK